MKVLESCKENLSDKSERMLEMYNEAQKVVVYPVKNVNETCVNAKNSLSNNNDNKNVVNYDEEMKISNKFACCCRLFSCCFASQRNIIETEIKKQAEIDTNMRKKRSDNDDTQILDDTAIYTATENLLRNEIESMEEILVSVKNLRGLNNDNI